MELDLAKASLLDLRAGPTVGQASTFALIGIYVGVIPVMMGLLWYPFIRRLSANKYNFFLSLTVGLLVFLGIDALLRITIFSTLAPAFNAQILIILIAILTFISLLYVSKKLLNVPQNRRQILNMKLKLSAILHQILNIQ